MSSAAVSLASTHPLSMRPSTSGQNPCGSRTPMRCASSIITNENPPASSGSTREQRLLEVATVGARLGGVLVGDELGDERGVGGGVEAGVAGLQAGEHAEVLGELDGVGEVAVVAEREAGVAHRAVHRLRVAPAARPGGGVAHVADGEVAVERGEAALVEHLRDQAHVLRHGDGLAVAHRDAGRLLAPVLQGVEPQVGEVGDALSGRIHAEHATGVTDLGVVHRFSLPRTPRTTPIPRGRFPSILPSGRGMTEGCREGVAPGAWWRRPAQR